MDIYRMQNEAKDRPEDQRKFKIIGPLGELEAEWGDPWFGFITIPSQGEGFFMVKQFDSAFPPLDFVWTETETSKEMG